MISEKYNIEFYPMTHHLNGKQTPDEYIEELITFLYNEIIIDRRFNKEDAKKLFNLVIERTK
jgi:hypothetical protein